MTQMNNTTTKDPKYKVVKIFRNSGRRRNIARNLTLEEAKRMVESFPDSARHMVCFFTQ